MRREIMRFTQAPREQIHEPWERLKKNLGNTLTMAYLNDKLCKPFMKDWMHNIGKWWMLHVEELL